MSQLDLEAIRARNEKRKRNYGESEQKAPGELYTTGADEDIDALIAEVERLAEIEGKLRRLYLQAMVRFKDE
jgi:hypothetical protein